MEKIGLVHWPHVSTTEQEQGRASTRIRVEETSVALARTIQIARWLGREWCETHANTAEVRTRREGREVIIETCGKDTGRASALIAHGTTVVVVLETISEERKGFSRATTRVLGPEQGWITGLMWSVDHTPKFAAAAAALAEREGAALPWRASSEIGNDVEIPGLVTMYGHGIMLAVVPDFDCAERITIAKAFGMSMHTFTYDAPPDTS